MISPLSRLCHWGPLSSIAICTLMTIATTSIKGNPLVGVVFQFTMCLCLYNMWSATFLDPGYYLPSLSEVKENSSDQQEDRQTSGGRSSATNRAIESMDHGRFCRKCCQIILNKHHHCPWINNCVGKSNEHYFVRFLTFGILVSLEAMFIIGFDTYQRYLMRSYILFNVFNIGLSLGVFLSLATLLYLH